jgi:hypothetical protein
VVGTRYKDKKQTVLILKVKSWKINVIYQKWIWK